MIPVNNPYTLNNQRGLFLSERAKKPFSEEREQYFTPPILPKETPDEKSPFDSIQPAGVSN